MELLKPIVLDNGQVVHLQLRIDASDMLQAWMNAGINQGGYAFVCLVICLFMCMSACVSISCFCRYVCCVGCYMGRLYYYWVEKMLATGRHVFF